MCSCDPGTNVSRVGGGIRTWDAKTTTKSQFSPVLVIGKGMGIGIWFRNCIPVSSLRSKCEKQVPSRKMWLSYASGISLRQESRHMAKELPAHGLGTRTQLPVRRGSCLCLHAESCNDEGNACQERETPNRSEDSILSFPACHTVSRRFRGSLSLSSDVSSLFSRHRLRNADSRPRVKGSTGNG